MNQAESIMKWVIRLCPSRRVVSLLLDKYRPFAEKGVRFVECFVDSVRFRLKVDTSEIYGYQMFMTGQIEPVTSYFVKCLMSSNRTMLDVGANIGYFSVLAASACPSCAVWSFEPAPDTYSLLVENIHANRLANVVANQIALGDRKDVLMLSVYNDQALNAIRPNIDAVHPFFPEGPIRDIEVPCTSIEEFCQEFDIPKVDIVKIDVEGFEYSVVKGASGLFESNNPPILLCEIEPLWLKRYGSITAGALIDYMESFGYHTIGLTRYGIFTKDRFADSPTIENFVFFQECHQAEIEKIGQSYFAGFLKIKVTIAVLLFPVWRILRRLI